MHTEEQAKECWCPFALSQDFVSKRGRVLTMGGPHNRLSIIQNGSSNDGQNANAYCIASKCMAFRWADTGDTLKSKIQAIKDHRNKTGATLKDAKEYVEANPHEWQPEARRGYCGLAGQPS